MFFNPLKIDQANKTKTHLSKGEFSNKEAWFKMKVKKKISNFQCFT